MFQVSFQTVFLQNEALSLFFWVRIRNVEAVQDKREKDVREHANRHLVSLKRSFSTSRTPLGRYEPRHAWDPKESTATSTLLVLLVKEPNEDEAVARRRAALPLPTPIA